jgi:hypothetical protein
MSGSKQIRARRFRLSVFAVAAAMTITIAPAAHAQNLLEALAKAFGGRSSPAPAQTGAPSDPNPWNLPERTAEQSGPRTSYCVRTCDGRFFPLPRSAGGAHMSTAQICSAMCPAAETSVYSGGSIEHSVNDKGKPYSSLKTAFLFRDKAVDGCTCTRGGAGGVAALDIKDDPTLRRGDIVVTRDGPRIYTGAKGIDRASAFVKPENFKGLSQSVRHELAAIQVAHEPNEAATLPVGARPASLPIAAQQPVADTPRGHVMVAPVHVTPVAEAFSSFVR